MSIGLANVPSRPPLTTTHTKVLSKSFTIRRNNSPSHALPFRSRSAGRLALRADSHLFNFVPMLWISRSDRCAGLTLYILRLVPSSVEADHSATAHHMVPVQGPRALQAVVIEGTVGATRGRHSLDNLFLSARLPLSHYRSCSQPCSPTKGR